MATPITERLATLEAHLDSFREEIQGIKKDLEKSSDSIGKLPEVFAKMLKDAMNEHEKNSDERLRLTLSPISEQAEKSSKNIHDLRARVMLLEFMKWQLVGLFTGAGIVIQLLFKFIF